MPTKMSFDQVENVFHALHIAFDPEGLELDEYEEQQMKAQCISLWTLFLTCSGWDEDEFFDELENAHECPKCKAEREEVEAKEKAAKIN
jgi:Zn finger protein HypA/HybF involved in hydrogenase expression